MQANAEILHAALSLGGIREIEGPRNSASIMEMYRTAGAQWVKSETVPWCSAAACHVAELAGAHNPKTLRAREWADIPAKYATRIESVDLLIPGDFVLLSRGTNPRKGHIAVHLHPVRGRLVLFGGNQRDSMCASEFSKKRFIVGFRMELLEACEPVDREQSAST